VIRLPAADSRGRQGGSSDSRRKGGKATVVGSWRVTHRLQASFCMLEETSHWSQSSIDTYDSQCVGVARRIPEVGHLNCIHQPR
jgi:hypothetical protein